MRIWKTYKAYMVSIVLVLALFCVCTNKLIVQYYSPIAMVKSDLPVEGAMTSTSFRYTAQFNKTLSNKRYARFQEMFRAQESTAMPGLACTDILGQNCADMVPQGICVAGEYMLISAYDHGNRDRAGRYRSVIYVLSNKKPQQRKYLTTIVLPDVNHVGGLAYDGRYVWVAKSTTKCCSAIDKRIIEKAVASGQNSYELTAYTATVDCGMTASFLTCYDNMLWVGDFVSRKNGVGSLVGFDISGRGADLRLQKKEALAIPHYANGAQFVRYAGKNCLAVVTSYSRYADSKVNIYEVYKGHDNATKKRKVADFAMPPMAEELVSDGKLIYAIFESGATEYSAPKYERCNNLVDRICAFSVSDFFADVKEGVAIRRTSDSHVPDLVIQCEALCPRENDFTRFVEYQQLKSSSPKKAALLSIYKYPDFYFASYYKYFPPWIQLERTG